MGMAPVGMAMAGMAVMGRAMVDTATEGRRRFLAADSACCACIRSVW